MCLFDEEAGVKEPCTNKKVLSCDSCPKFKAFIALIVSEVID
jgi:hypothetical protein